MSKITLKRDAVILDMGCGAGYLTSYLAEHYETAMAIGLDKDIGAIIHAKKTFANKKNVKYIYLDYEMFPLHDETYDLICFFDTLSFIPSENVHTVLSHCFKSLKTVGKIAIFTSYPSSSNPMSSKADERPIVKWTKQHGIKMNSYDLTDGHKEYWKKARNVALQLEEAFLSEMPQEYKILLKEYEYWAHMSEISGEAGIHRFLYIIEK